MGRDAGDGDLGPDEPAVGGADLPFGWLGDHRGVDAGRIELGEDFLDAQAGVLLVGDGDDDDLAVDASEGGFPAGDEGGGEAGLHVVRAAGVEPVAVDAGRECVPGAGESDSVEVAAQKQPAAAGVASAAQDDAGPAGRALGYLRVQSGGSSPVGDDSCDVRLAGAARVEAGVDRVDAQEGVEQVQDGQVVGGHGWSAGRTTALAGTSVPTVPVIGRDLPC